jgi:hypothetical protein
MSYDINTFKHQHHYKDIISRGDSMTTNQRSESIVEKATAPTGLLQSLSQKKERRSKRIQSLITERSYNTISIIAKRAEISFNELLNALIETGLEREGFYDISKEIVLNKPHHEQVGSS